MKNRVIVEMVCDQFGVDSRDVEVECVAMVDGTYEFLVEHHPRYTGKPFTKNIFIKVVDHD